MESAGDIKLKKQVEMVFMANRWGNSGNSNRLFLGSKITADGDYSHEIKRRLLPGRKVITNLDRILKSRGITLPTKVCLVKAMVFPVDHRHKSREPRVSCPNP